MDMREHVKALNERRIKLNKEQQDLIDKRVAEHPGEPFNEEDRATLAKMDADFDALTVEVKAFADRENREDDDALLREANAQVFGTERHLERQEASFEARFTSW